MVVAASLAQRLHCQGMWLAAASSLQPAASWPAGCCARFRRKIDGRLGPQERTTTGPHRDICLCSGPQPLFKSCPPTAQAGDSIEFVWSGLTHDVWQIPSGTCPDLFIEDAVTGISKVGSGEFLFLTLSHKCQGSGIATDCMLLHRAARQRLDVACL